MKDLNAAFDYCKTLLDEANIEYGKIKNVIINTRAKHIYGQCKAVPGGYSISISDRLLDDNLDDMALNNTVMHEILHTVKGCMNHGELWKRYANKVNLKYNFNIKRTTSYTEKGIEKPAQSPKPIKHRFICEKCGCVIERERESRFTKNYKNYRCARCCGNFRKEF